MDASAVNGTSTAPIRITGVKSGTSNEPPVASDWAYTTARPLIAASTYQWKFGNYWIFRNLRVTTAEQYGFFGNTYCTWINCYSYNSSASSGYAAIYGEGNYCNFIGCEGISTNGDAFGLSGANMDVISCYAHDSDIGYGNLAGNANILHCIADTCATYGIEIATRDYSSVLQCTIYNCGVGIYGTTAVMCIFLNNIIDACTTGASWTSEVATNIWDYNCWDNTTDTSNVTKGPNAVTGDPSMTDPANGDFSIPNNSNCVDAALDAGDYTDATV